MFDVSQLTLNPAEVQRASELIVEKGFKTGRLSELFDIQTGIMQKKQIVFAKRLGVGGGSPTGCKPKDIGNIKTSQKYWDPALVTGRLIYCANDENRLFKILSKWKQAYPDFFKEIPDDVMAMVVALLLDHIETSVIAKGWFSDTAADTVANGGSFANGTDLDVFNQLDGVWKQIFAETSIPKFDVAKNNGANYASQKVTADEAYAIVEGIYDNASERLKGDPDAVIYVTSGVYHGYKKKIVEIEGAGGITETLIGGRKSVAYMGVPVINMVDWSEVITTYLNDGTKYVLPNRAVMTVKENIPFGTLSKNDLTNLESIYDKVGKQVLTDYAYFIDAKLLDNELISVAY